MKTYTNPSKKEQQLICQRPTIENSELKPAVSSIMEAVKSEGDKAVIDFTSRFDGVQLNQIKLEVPAKISLSDELKSAIDVAWSNIRKFHESQRETEQKVETTEGVFCWRKSIPIQKVGLYIPGGSAPLFSTLLMLGIPAKIAGCSKLVVCTPPQKDGSVDSAIFYVAQKLGLKHIYTVGGAQAIAALTYGTETIPKVDKIFGPGNQYVTMAKQLAQENGVAIDIPAGPSEVLVIADESCEPDFVAADLLSQAEHGPDSQVILVCIGKHELAKQIADEVEGQLNLLPRKETAEKALNNSSIVVFDNYRSAMDFSNKYAPEHLIIATQNCDELANQVVNAGSVFLGNYSCESAGDYASGTNHTLPTNGYARSYSGVSLDSFLKKVTFQKLTAAGIQNIGTSIETMAAAEQLDAHRNAVSLRLKKLNDG